MAKKVYVITGPIGSGKSTAIEYLKNKVNYIDSSENHFIPSPKKWSESLSKLSK